MKMRKSAAFILSVLFFFTAAPAQPAYAGNAEETPGCQLQTILIDNDGKNLWTTESWGGANILPNTSWTTTDAGDYYYNGALSFKAKSNGAEPLSFILCARKKATAPDTRRGKHVGCCKGDSIQLISARFISVRSAAFSLPSLLKSPACQSASTVFCSARSHLCTSTMSFSSNAPF